MSQINFNSDTGVEFSITCCHAVTIDRFHCIVHSILLFQSVMCVQKGLTMWMVCVYSRVTVQRDRTSSGTQWYVQFSIVTSTSPVLHFYIMKALLFLFCFSTLLVLRRHSFLFIPNTNANDPRPRRISIQDCIHYFFVLS